MAVPPTIDYPQLLEIDTDVEVNETTFTANGEYLVCATTQDVRVWRVEDGKQVATMPVEGSNWCLASSRDGKWIAGGSDDGNVFVCNATTYEKVFWGHSASAEINDVDISPDATHLVSSESDSGTATIWDIREGRKVRTLDHSGVLVKAAKYSPRGERIATTTGESVRVWDANDGRLLVDASAQVKGWRSLHWCRNTLFVQTQDNSMKQINATTGVTISEWSVPVLGKTYTALPQHGKYIAHSTDKTITFWDTVTHAPIGCIEHNQDIFSFAFSPDDSRLAIVPPGLNIVVKEVFRPIPEPDLGIDTTTLDAWKHGKLADAEALLSPTSESGSHRIQANRALVRARMGKWDEALVDAKQSLKNQQSLVGYIAKCTALVGMGEKEKGIHVCDIAARHFPEQAVLLDLVKAIVLSMAGNHVDAISRILHLVHGQADPALDTVQGYVHLCDGKTHMEGGEYKRAIQSFKDAGNKLGNGTRQPPQIVTLMSGWEFDDLAITNHRHICEALFAMGRVKEAAESLLLMLDEVTEMTEPTKTWVSSFKSQCHGKLVEIGNRAMQAKQYAEADSNYTVASLLEPAGEQDLLTEQAKARTEKEKWEIILDEANEAIKLNPSSSSDYERKCTALHGLGRDKEAVDAFETMISKMSESSDPEIRKRADLYLRTQDAIGIAIENAISDSPFVLINALSGRLCDKIEQAAAFKSTLAFMTLVMSMNTHIDYVRIEEEVGKFYRYATFSHTWEGEEPLYKDVIKIVVYDLEKSHTHDKLRTFCKIAQELGFTWAWSDTCCINQKDPPLHQKSIVRMFEWYEGSAMTIIFLYDVDKDAPPGSLTRSRWNSRGWTLQEYHASKVVQIYTKDWTPYLGLTIYNHKESPEIISEMEKATGISAEALKALDPGLNNVREKLCLASTRQTTKPEDAAYSLLGIFSMDLRVAYNEGDKALGRFLATLLMTSGDTSILAWTGTSGSYNSCLPTKINVFSQPPTSHIPRAIDDDEMGELTTKLRHYSKFNLDLATKLHDELHVLPIPYFQGQKMKLPCLAFRVTDVSSSRGSEQVFHLKTTVLEKSVDVKTEEKLPKGSFLHVFHSRTDIFLVYPWMDFLLDRYLLGGSSWLDRAAIFGESAHDVMEGLGDEENSPSPSSVLPKDKQTLVYEFLARLRQPFGAVLLTRTQRNPPEFKRIATESLIKVQVGRITSARLREVIESVQTLTVV